MLEEVIMSDRHRSDGQMYPFSQLLSILKKLAETEEDWIVL